MFFCSFKPVTYQKQHHKIIAWFSLICLNIFFVYYVIVLGFVRGKDFQQTYVMLAVFQFIFEIVFYETTECIYINYFIPQMAYRSFQSVYIDIQRSAEAACYSLQTRECTLNAANYLFVSTNLSFHYPDFLGNK